MKETDRNKAFILLLNLPCARPCAGWWDTVGNKPGNIPALVKFRV